MNSLYTENYENWTEKPTLDPIKMKKVREILKKQVVSPNYAKWRPDDEVKLIGELAMHNLPPEYSDIKLDAQQLYSNYMIWKFQKKLPGIDSWKKQFDDFFEEERKNAEL